MMKITSAHVWVGRRRATGRDKLSQIASFDEQSALNCVLPPMFPPSHSTCAGDIIFFLRLFHYPFEPSCLVRPEPESLCRFTFPINSEAAGQY